MSKYEKISAFAHRLTTTKLDCGKTFRELTEHDGLSLWWFAHFDFLLFLLTLPEKPGSKMPKNLRFQSFVSKLPTCVFAGLNFCFDLARKLVVKSILLSNKKPEPKDDRKKILFTSRDITWREVKDYQTGEIKKTDIFLDSLLEKLQNKEGMALVGTYPLVKYIYPFKSAIKSLGILIERVKGWDIPYRPFNLYWSANIAKKELQAARHFNKVWKTLSTDRLFHSLCRFENDDDFDLIYRKLKFYFMVLLPYVVKRIEMSKQLLEKEQPDMVLLVNEYGIFERSLLIASKKKGIPTVAIQHGNISKFSNGYIYAKDEVSPNGSVGAPFCPIPDKTLVFGQHYKDVLTQVSAYPDESVIVTGQPGYDILNTIKEHCSREDILAEYGIDKNKKVVLWTTQCLVLSDEENKKNLCAVRDAIERLDNAVLVIKQHPREEGRHTQLIRSSLNLPNEKFVLTFKTADTLALLYACDVMVTKFSTTASEALALDKPVIILNLSGEADLISYVDEGAAVGVYEDRDLERAISKCLDNDAELLEKRISYIQRHLYKIDGNATQRATEVIKQILAV